MIHVLSEKDSNHETEIRVLRCHLAFVAPTNANFWTLTAIDKFNEFIKRYNGLAITIPSVVSSPTNSTGVILWGSNKQNEQINGPFNANQDAWLNINVQMIFQAVARSTIDIDAFQYHSTNRIDFEEQLLSKNVPRWPAAESYLCQQFTGKNSFFYLCIRKIFFIKEILCIPTGIAVGLNAELAIFVQEVKHQEKIRKMSETLAKQQWKDVNSSKKFKKRELCIVKRENGYFYRAEVKSVYKERQKCLVMKCFILICMRIPMTTILIRAFVSLLYRFSFQILAVKLKWISRICRRKLCSEMYQFKFENVVCSIPFIQHKRTFHWPCNLVSIGF